jgi:hypothetical protein
MITYALSVLHMSLFIFLHIKMMKVCPSRPSSKDHYILREIMLRRMKVFNH